MEVDVNYHKSDIYMGNLCACQRKDLSSAVDPLTGLNARDIELIKMSWFNMCKHASVKDTGTAFFLKLFDDHPYMKNYFAMFTDKESNVGITCVFRAHAISVFCELFKYIDYLEDPEMVVALIEKRTRGHFRNDVTLTDMENLGKSLLEFLEERLGGLASVPEVLEAWAKFLKLHNAVFQNKCDELVMAQKVDARNADYRHQASQSRQGSRSTYL